MGSFVGQKSIWNTLMLIWARKCGAVPHMIPTDTENVALELSILTWTLSIVIVPESITSVEYLPTYLDVVATKKGTTWGAIFLPRCSKVAEAVDLPRLVVALLVPLLL